MSAPKMFELPADKAAAESLFAECGDELTPEQAEFFSEWEKEFEKETAPLVFNGWANMAHFFDCRAASEEGRLAQVRKHAEEIQQRITSAKNASKRIEATMKKMGMTLGLLTTTVKKTETTKEIPGRKIVTEPDGWKLGVQNAGGNLALQPEDLDVPTLKKAGLQRFVKTVEVVDKSLIREELEAGADLGVAWLKPREVLFTRK